MPTARFARTFLQAGARRAQMTAPRRMVARRNMASEAHAAPVKSDKPWIIGSALIFGPLILYLVSPSARKDLSHHAVHNDKREYPTSATHDAFPEAKAAVHKQSETHAASEPAPVIMTDDDGTEANIAGSLALEEKANVPKAAVSDAELDSAKERAAQDSFVATENHGASAESSSAGERSKGTFQKDEEGPTDQAVAAQSAREHITPKEHVELSKESGTTES
ncbi:hypothetical protein FA15DRAFT_666283 [Coprinopsis marcescibilis]|uniref:Uncharacterized protein n=1 Tax=Coprinopsis marcescibilis TaxID=230819 RepID=A0A5C3LGG1_COPMA|nr:hypothetical protein FA15DRAFT_666283 [Coprinopsis marcescibilis]